MNVGTMMNTTSKWLYFPWMHADLAPEWIRSGVLFLDSGLGGQESAFHPEGLPLDERAARKYLAEALQFGNQFKKSGEMTALGSLGMNAYLSETDSQIQSEIQGVYRAEPIDRAKEVNTLRTKAQMTLLLAWTLEDRLLEIRPLQALLNESWQQLGTSLGRDDEDDEIAALSLSTDLLENQDSNPLGTLATYSSVLQAFMILVPASMALVTTEPLILDRWDELSLPFVPVASEIALPGGTISPGAIMAKASGADFLGLKTTSSPENWLTDERTMIYIPTEGTDGSFSGRG